VVEGSDRWLVILGLEGEAREGRQDSTGQALLVAGSRVP